MRFLLTTSLRPELVKVWVCQETTPGGSLLPPVDLASIASTIRSLGHEVRLADLRTQSYPMAYYQEQLRDFEPDAVILNLSTTSAMIDYELLAATPKKVKKICFGTHAQSMRDECFSKGIDFVLLGDPEAGVSELIRFQMDGTSAPGVLTSEAMQKEPHYWEDLDQLPFPALDLLDLDKYHAPYIRRGSRFTLLLSGRGCPYKCTYCLYPVLFGNKARYRSAKCVVDEIQYNFERFGIRDFYFLDATFNLQQKRVEEFCQELLKRKLDIAWICNMRVAPTPAEMLELMKKAGCRWVFYGVEDQDFLKETKKGTTKNATIDAFAKTKQAGISTMAFTMVFPREGVDQAQYSQEILRTLERLGADAFQCNVAIPFPGTEIYDEYVKKHGALSTDWSLYDPHGAKLPYEHDQDLVGIKRSVYWGFLVRNPGRVLKVAMQMELKALLQLARRFVQENLWPRAG
jgi:anaerobic magnesium-protoporphyrin IX monomethyl ester cyclase